MGDAVQVREHVSIDGLKWEGAGVRVYIQPSASQRMCVRVRVSVSNGGSRNSPPVIRRRAFAWLYSVVSGLDVAQRLVLHSESDACPSQGSRWMLSGTWVPGGCSTNMPLFCDETYLCLRSQPLSLASLTSPRTKTCFISGGYSRAAINRGCWNTSVSMATAGRIRAARSLARGKPEFPRLARRETPFRSCEGQRGCSLHCGGIAPPHSTGKPGALDLQTDPA